MSDAAGRTRVLFICQDVVGTHMAGSGIRAWNLCTVLAASCEVTLAAPVRRDLLAAPFRVQAVTLEQPAEIDGLLDAAEVVVSNGNLLHDYPQLIELTVPWVVDAYVPTPSEALAANRHREPAERLAGHRADTAAVLCFLSRADLVLCASERQRDLYVGLLAAAGRLNPYVYDEDPTMRNLVDVVPYGLPARPPQHTRRVLKGAVPSIGEDDRVILWGGGIWNWFDPLTLITALGEVVETIPEARLCFPGTRHPFAERVPDMEMRARAVELSDRLGSTHRHVLFGEWAGYDDRADYLLEADIGVSLHLDGIEPRYAYRTRILDYIWAGLPMVVTEGDVLADLVRERGLGYVVAPGDVAGVREAILALLAESDARGARAQAFRQVAEEFTWERVAQPLVAFCRQPRLAADKRAGYAPRSQAAREDTRRLGELEELVAAYERGRFIRAMAALKRWRRRLQGGGRSA